MIEGMQVNEFYPYAQTHLWNLFQMPGVDKMPATQRPWLPLW